MNIYPAPFWAAHIYMSQIFMLRELEIGGDALMILDYATVWKSWLRKFTSSDHKHGRK